MAATGTQVWGDEQSDFVCNTRQPGCENVCYDHAFPISHVRFWALQIIAVATPKLLYLGYVLHVLHVEKKLKERMQKRAELDDQTLLFLQRSFKIPKYIKSNGKINIRGRLLRAYVLHLVANIFLESAFVVGQYFLYGLKLDARYVCSRSPCPHQVDCFLSRPTEKSLIIWFMLGAASLSLALCVAELLYLCVRAAKDCAARRRDYTVTPVTPATPAARAKAYVARDDAGMQNGFNVELEQRGRKFDLGGANEMAGLGSAGRTGEVQI